MTSAIALLTWLGSIALVLLGLFWVLRGER